MLWLSAFCLFLSISTLCSGKVKMISEEFIKSINILKPTWVAGRNFPKNTSAEHLRKIGSGGFKNSNENFIYAIHNLTVAIPDSFDSRTAWPNCGSITKIRDQGSCGSCWAFGAAEVMTDRLCIQSRGFAKFNFSPEDILSCCGTCGNCSGGYATRAWEYWISYGVVSGGDDRSNEGCRPYTDDAHSGITPPCTQACQSSYPTPYQKDKRFGITRYYAGPTVQQIQMEIMTKGPVEAFMEIYQDFYNYKSGVYQHVAGNYVGNHFVKMIGWGVDRGIPYWLLVNSWGTGWGDGGLFKIIRGENHVQIEKQLDAGVASI